MKKLYLVICLLFFAVNLFGQKTNEDLLVGSEKTLYSEGKYDTDRCFVFKNYVVKTSPDTKNGGESITVYSRNAASTPKDSCQSSEKSILSLSSTYSGKGEGTGENILSNFYGISDKYLFIHKDVEPYQSAFEIFDLTSGKSLYKAEYYPNLKLLQKRFVYFENWTEKDGLIKNCKTARKWQKEGLGVGWVKKSQIDLQNLKVRNLGLRCEAMP